MFNSFPQITEPTASVRVAVMDDTAVLTHFNFSCTERLSFDIFYIFFP